MEITTLHPLEFLANIRLRVFGSGQDAQPYPIPQRGVQFLYTFEPTPCVYAYHADGTVYRMLLDGTSFLRSGDSELLMPGCPHPHQVLWTGQFRQFVWRNRARLPLVVLALASLTALQIVMGNLPELGEVNRYFIGIFAWVVNMALCGFLLLAALACVSAYFGDGILRAITRVEPDGTAGLLGPGALSIGQDLLLCSAESETAAQWAERVDAAIQGMGDRWLLIVPFRAPIAMVIIPSVDGQPLADKSAGVRPGQAPEYFEEQFSRTAPPFPVSVPAISSAYLSETFQQYHSYLSAICPAFMAWAAERKALVRPAADMAKQYVGCLVCLLLSLACSAEPKSVQVANYLGHRAELPAPKGEVAFVFERQQLTRYADGAKTYLQLLKGAPMFTDADDCGRLQAVFAGNAKIESAPRQVEQAAATVGQGSARPLSEAQPQIQWDSAGLRREFDEKGERLKGGMKLGGQIIRAWWESELWGAILQILLMVGGLARSFAKVSFSEHRGSPAGHWYGRGTYNFGTACNMVLKACSVVFCLVFLTHFYVCAVEIKSVFGILGYVFSLLWTWWTAFAIVWFFLLAGVEKVFSHIIPNPRIHPDNPNTPFINHTNRQLGAGQ